MGNNVITLRNVSVCHSQNKRRGSSADVVLTNVSLDVGQGELIYLIGKIGSGKSSLLKSLYGEIPIYSGEGSVVGYNLSRLRSHDIPYLRRKLGIVFPDFQLLPDRNLYDNLEFALRATGWRRRGEISSRIEQVMKLIDLSHKAFNSPHHLSRGEQQRLAIGRAFINHPELILADEPTGNLDIDATEEVMQLFMDIKSMGTSVVIATHDISIIERYPSRIYAFEDGEMFEIEVEDFLGINNEEE